MRRRMLARVVQAPRHRLVQRLDGERGFAAARHAGDAGEGAERHFRGDVLQIVARRADQLEPAIVHGAPPLRRHRNLPRARQILPGQARRVAHDVVRQALGHDLAAMDAGARTHVDDMIGGADRLVVVLDHDHRVAEIAQALERCQQPLIVALMQADRGLVQHVQHARQARADLRGEPDALAFAARQRAGGARQRQIFQPDIVEECEPRADFLQHARRDFLLLGVELLVERREPVVGGADRKLADLADMQARDLHAQRFGLQPVAVAHFARAFGLVALQLLADPGRIGLLVAPLHVGDDAFERLLDVVAAQPVVVGELDLLLARAEQDDVLAPSSAARPTACSARPCSAARSHRASADNRATTISTRARSRPCAATASRRAPPARDRNRASCRARRIRGRRRADC